MGTLRSIEVEVEWLPSLAIAPGLSSSAIEPRQTHPYINPTSHPRYFPSPTHATCSRQPPQATCNESNDYLRLPLFQHFPKSSYVHPPLHINIYLTACITGLATVSNLQRVQRLSPVTTLPTLFQVFVCSPTSSYKHLSNCLYHRT
jgi:hypothetical protein